jgi:glycosyltransferase involved in cell wall biosynthesis
MPRTVAFTLEVRGPQPDAAEQPFVDDIRRRLGDDPRVSFGPPVAPEDIPAVLAAFDVLCCPSIWFENGPTIALESIGVGTPVLGTRLGNLAELIHDGVDGRLVAPGDDAELARAISDIARDPAMVDRWRAALPRVRTMEEVTADYLQMYQQLLRERAVA